MANPPHQPDDRVLDVLTGREREVLAMVGRDRAQLVVLAYETGLARAGQD